MTRAVATFTVAVKRRRVRVRVLPTVRDVHRACMDGTRRRDGKTVFAFFAPRMSAPDIGTIVLPRDRMGPDLLAHEATHAAVHAERVRMMAPRSWMVLDDAAEERIAEFAGLLCERITRRLNEVIR